VSIFVQITITDLAMKKIHVLPTDKPSRLFYNKKDSIFTIDNDFENVIEEDWFQDYNIYITNDEEIKEGDWFISLNDDESFMDVIKNTEENFSDFADEEWIYDCKKIILTTDQDLIKDGVQAIDNDFLEWFVKNPSCESVEIERDSREVGGHNGGVAIEYGLYEIIIPKEEPKQETLEEDKNGNIIQFLYGSHSYDGVWFGDKHPTKKGSFWWRSVLKEWQQQQNKNLYSEEEVLKLFKSYQNKFPLHRGIQVLDSEFNEWFEQFKKK